MILQAILAVALSRPHVDRATWALIAADAATRGLDAFSTRQMLQNPRNHEKFLPDAISHHTGTMYAFSGAVVTVNAFATHELVKHRHPRLAKVALMVDIGQDAPWAVHNLFLPKKH